MLRLPQAVLNAINKHRAELELHETQEMNTGVLSSIKAHIAVIDKNGNLIATNTAWNNFAIENGVTSLERVATGNNYFSVCENAANKGDSDAAVALTGIQSIFKKEKHFFEMEYPCHSPLRKRWFHLSVTKFGEDDSKVVISHQEITETKIAQNKLKETSAELKKTLFEYHKILDSSLDVICTVNKDGEFVNVSAASKQIWGYTPEELKGTKFMNLVYAEDTEITKATSQIFKSNNQMPAFENRYVHKNGKIVPLLWSVKWDKKSDLFFCLAKDITERKIADRATENERDQFYNMFLKAPSAVGVLKGIHHIFEMTNPLYLQMIGKKDIIGKTVEEVLPEVIDQGFIDILDNVYRTDESHTNREKLVKIDKEGKGKLTNVYINCVYQAYRNIKGEIEGVFFFINDVTEQIESRKAIVASETKYRKIVETAQEGIWLLDENGRTTFVNKKICDMLEYTEAEMLGKENYHFMGENGKNETLMAREGRSKNITESLEYTFVSKSGKHVLTKVSANPIFDDHGRFKGSLGMVSDITEKKHLENLLEKSNKLARIGSWEIDLHKDGVYWSDITKEILDASPDFVPELSDGIKIFTDEETKNSISALAKQCIDDGIPWDEELQFISFEGNIKWMRTIGEAEFVNGECSKIYGSSQDITERKKAEIERTKMISDIVQRNSDLEQFSYIVSHNLRAPTANIIGFAEILKNEILTPQEREASMQGLSASVNELDTVIKDINSILQNKGEVHEKKEMIFFSELVDSILISVGNLIEKHRVNITTNFAEVNKIFSLKSYMYSIFYNLISNSIKYAKPNEAPIIQIKSRKENEKIILTFKDKGLGLDMKTKGDKIFGLYSRFHSNVEGKGMGLFMVKTQVESLGGKITIDSELNKGTEFTIVFET
ncbi:PAS domain S-box protein [Mesonia ostreae]|uniref:histidine kinase n=1 Tax=Mesonia ostreae TaxID=861110 RepID=A0ABU2KG62_9FLAO|nr:PAS domain S-box protein [Mesonia ostreae]MDT0293698.1 PAS domain S-box protein [Mesonia ostreae]